MQLVKLDSLVKQFDGHSIISIPSYSLDAGKGYVVYGYNGCGKTTLLKLLAGLEKPTSGTVECALERNRVMCFQHPYMFTGTVMQNLVYGVKLQKRILDETSVIKMASRYGIENILDRHAKVLSSGQKQTVALIRAFLVQPHLLLLDEPSANLDKHRFDALCEDLDNLRKCGGSFVITMHSNQRILFPVDHCCKLENGNILNDDGLVKKTGRSLSESSVELTGDEAAALMALSPYINENSVQCSDAFKACELGTIPRGTLATLIDKRNIRLKNCQWGCFK